MRVFELMAELAIMPAGAEVAFRRLATKDECPKYPNEPSLIELDFTIRQVEDREDYRGRPVIVLDGWAE